MNMKKTWKRFFSLNRRHAEGFTLVELIVVIAILAILGGVAVPAYSGYVEKANIGADQTLVSEVAHALALYYYANPDTAGGYVVLNKDGTDSIADEVGTAAMLASFGDGWEKTAVLKYDKWNSGGMMNVVNGYTDEELDKITNSSYLTTSTPASLMQAVTGMTGLANKVISDRVDDLDEARNNLVTLFGAESDIVKRLDSFEMDDEDEYTTVISNMLVNQMATSVESTPNLQGMLNLYAAAYTYGEANNDFGAFNAMTERLESDEFNMGILTGDGEQGDGTGFNFLAGALLDEKGDIKSEYLGFTNYMDPPEGAEGEATNKFQNDMDALATMMGAVKEISGGFMDKDSLLNKDLFTSDSVMEQVNAYYNSLKAMADMDPNARTELAGVPEGAIVVFIANDGSIAVIPGEAYAASK